MAENDKSNAKDSAAKDSAPKARSTRDGSEPALDPKLDNRVGEQRPYMTGIKPQQVYGGFPGDESEEEDPRSEEVVSEGDFVGHGSDGPHGRGPAAGRAEAAHRDGEA
jgi:hypothetical protein